MLTVRPKVAELAFQLYGRALHPELFQIYKQQRIERGDWKWCFTADRVLSSAARYFHHYFKSFEKELEETFCSEEKVLE